MDNINLLQLIISDSVFSLELLALFAVGFYLIIAIAAFPISPRHLSFSPATYLGQDCTLRENKDKMAPLRGAMESLQRAISLPNYSSALRVKPAQLQIGFRFATIVGVGSVLSPARTWLRQDPRNKY